MLSERPTFLPRLSTRQLPSLALSFYELSHTRLHHFPDILCSSILLWLAIFLQSPLPGKLLRILQNPVQTFLPPWSFTESHPTLGNTTVQLTLPSKPWTGGYQDLFSLVWERRWAENKSHSSLSSQPPLEDPIQNRDSMMLHWINKSIRAELFPWHKTSILHPLHP